jgi:hypothetical protein
MGFLCNTAAITGEMTEGTLHHHHHPILGLLNHAMDITTWNSSIFWWVSYNPFLASYQSSLCQNVFSVSSALFFKLRCLFSL